MKPEISIIVPCYNRSAMLKECIDSFLGQKYQNFEIIIGDDGSEESLSFVTTIDKRIKYFKQDRNGYGADRARNKALEYVEGNYILQFDSDDIAKSRLLSSELKILKKHKEYDVVYSDYITKNVNGAKEKCYLEDCNNTQEDYLRMLNHQFIPHGGTLWRREKMLLHDETLPSAADWDLYLKAMEQGIKFYHLKEFLWLFRIGHERESYSERQSVGCDMLLKRRGYTFDKETRQGLKYGTHN